jgi:hypothetical protein
VLIVRDVGEPYGPLSTHDWADWEIEHFDDCPSEVIGEDDAGNPFTAWRCPVGGQEESCGVRWSLRYSGTPVEKPGRYLIETWSEVQRGYGWTEYDNGLRLADASSDEAAVSCPDELEGPET